MSLNREERELLEMIRNNGDSRGQIFYSQRRTAGILNSLHRKKYVRLENMSKVVADKYWDGVRHYYVPVEPPLKESEEGGLKDNGWRRPNDRKKRCMVPSELTGKNWQFNQKADEFQFEEMKTKKEMARSKSVKIQRPIVNSNSQLIANGILTKSQGVYTFKYTLGDKKIESVIKFTDDEVVKTIGNTVFLKADAK